MIQECAGCGEIGHCEWAPNSRSLGWSPSTFTAMDESPLVLDVTFHPACGMWCIGWNADDTEDDHVYAWGESLNEAYDDLVQFVGFDPRYSTEASQS